MMSSTPDALRTYRDTLARQLCAAPAPGGEPFAYLLSADEHGVLLHLGALGLPMVLLQAEEGADLEPLRQRMLRIAAQAEAHGAHLAVVGGGQPARELLTGLDVGARGSLHQVMGDGSVWSRGEALGPLSHAAREIVEHGRAGPWITPDEAGQARARFEALARAESTFARSLSTTRPQATVALVAVCLMLFALKQWWGGILPTDLRMGAVDGSLVRAGEWWRLFAGTFLHGDVMHVAANLWSLWSLGRFLERLLGTGRFVVLYGLSGLAGAVASAALHPDVPSVGASGAIFGLLGGLAGLAFGRGRLLPPTITAQLRRSLWQPILVNTAVSFMPGVDALAHAGGAAMGLLLVGGGWILAGLPETAASPSRRVWTWAAGLVVAAMSGSLGAAMSQGRPWELTGAPSLVPVEVPGTQASLRLPWGLRPRGCEPRGAGTECSFGDLSKDPMVVVLGLAPSASKEVTDADVALVGGPPDEGFKADGALVHETAGGYELVRSRQVAPNGVRIVRTVTYRPGWRVELMMALRPGLAQAWEEAAAPIATSLAVR
jgi:membrane associated rhomboid family serine protease